MVFLLKALLKTYPGNGPI